MPTGRTRLLGACGLQVLLRYQRSYHNLFVHENSMRCPRPTRRCVLVVSVVLGFLVLVITHYSIISKKTNKPLAWHFNPAFKKQVHKYVLSVLADKCYPSRMRQSLLARLPASSRETQPFLSKDAPLSKDLFLYPPPFGFRGLGGMVDDLLKLLPDYMPLAEKTPDKCRRCVVVGNGGILRGLELGSLIDRFDTIIRLNSGPLGEFSVDVGNRTSIRMSYPEGMPNQWPDTDPQTLFAGVVYKRVDITWMSAMIRKSNVPLWDWFFFWQKVPSEIPLEPKMFKLLNPRVVRETALDLLKYPPPRSPMWGWDQNVPTLGVCALNLASLLCDEVSLAGFGYNLSQKRAPLHYYDELHMSDMLQQKMHNVDRETELLNSLVKEGTITDLTAGIHCSFCNS
ncbi:lactosylceramide alpha-2,3-sialyltransferase isoform X2 [Channa argus]|uniref:lactosylceramide alpha-2,3-sialyltransferase isoform X2 n=1 Tax=Channa argus TaxID=215402 RepID=UPI003522ABF0